MYGAKHPQTIGSLNNYATVLMQLGRANEAEPLFAEILQSDQEMLGAKHPETLNSLNSYAGVLYALGRAIEAEPLHAKALRLRREVLGAKHPETLESLNDYADVLNALGRAEEAESLFAETLRLRREVLGSKHPETLESLNKLSHLRIGFPSRSHLALEPARLHTQLAGVEARMKEIDQRLKKEAPEYFALIKLVSAFRRSTEADAPAGTAPAQSAGAVLC